MLRHTGATEAEPGNETKRHFVVICRGFESLVRYIAKPTISEALFSYRRAA